MNSYIVTYTFVGGSEESFMIRHPSDSLREVCDYLTSNKLMTHICSDGNRARIVNNDHVAYMEVTRK